MLQCTFKLFLHCFFKLLQFPIDFLLVFFFFQSGFRTILLSDFLLFSPLFIFDSSLFLHVLVFNLLFLLFVFLLQLLLLLQKFMFSLLLLFFLLSLKLQLKQRIMIDSRCLSYIRLQGSYHDTLTANCWNWFYFASFLDYYFSK